VLFVLYLVNRRSWQLANMEYVINRKAAQTDKAQIKVQKYVLHAPFYLRAAGAP
jgi:hypothetical protein